MSNSIPTDEQIAAGNSFIRRKPLDDVHPAMLVIEVKSERYTLDVNSLDYHERSAVADHLGRRTTLVKELLLGNELAAWVAAYVAVRRVHPETLFSEIAALTVRDFDVIELPVDEDTAPLDDDSSPSPSAETSTPTDEPMPEGSSSADSPTDD